MGAKERVQKYRSLGGAAEMVRVEVLVPADCRRQVLDEAARLRAVHRGQRALGPEEARMFDEATKRYGSRCFWNCKPTRTLAGLRVVAEQLMAHGDMRAWELACDIQEAIADAA